MSRRFRAVKEEWFASSSEFLDSIQLEVLFSRICKDLDTECCSTDYREIVSLWISNGVRFLDFIESDSFNVGYVRRILGAEFLDIELETNDSNEEALSSNMKNLVPNWRQAIHNDSLTFYLD